MSAGTAYWDVNDTIVAIASGAHAAARGIVRITGPATCDLVQSVFVSDLNGDGPWTPDLHRPLRYQGQVRLQVGSQQLGWPAALWLWPNARSYTGQPSAEFHLLGAPGILQKLVQQCCRHGGRLAGPGEFTMRAFLAGRMDLVQAEAVLGIIHAQDPQQLQTGLAQLAGGLSHPLQQIRLQLIHLLAHLEAGLDFAEEDIQFITPETLLANIQEIHQSVQNTLKQIQSRDENRNLVQVALLGAPNAGKSSLFNCLAEHQHAIVSDIQGTTRDYLRTVLKVGNLECLLVDTAGLDRWHDPVHNPESADDNIDRQSQAAARQLIQQSDIVLLCLAPESSDSLENWQSVLQLPESNAHQRPVLIVDTKADLQLPPSSATDLRFSRRSISTVTGQGIEELKSWLYAQVSQHQQLRQERQGTIGARTQQELERVLESLNLAAANVVAGGGEELVAAELRTAIDHLGKLVGTIYTDDLLDSIFSRFCIGK